MEFEESLPPNVNIIDAEEIKLQKYKSYKLKLEDDIYELEIDSNEKIYFKAKQENKLTSINYIQNFGYEEIIKKLSLSKEYYNNINKVFEFFDTALTKDKVYLKMTKNHNLKLIVKKNIDFHEVECSLELKENKLKNEELMEKLLIRMNEIKSNNSRNKEELSLIKKENEELKKKIDLLIEENKLIKKEKGEKDTILNNIKISLEEMKNDIKRLNEENKNLKENKVQIKDDIDKKENPLDFVYVEDICQNYESFGTLYDFEVFIGLTDKKEYIAYCTKQEKGKFYAIHIMRLLDNENIKTLIIQEIITVIKYYLTDNKKEYLLSCDKSNNIIIWEIQNNYNIKYSIKLSHEGNKNYINDVLLQFNRDNKNYMIIPRRSVDYFTLLYEIGEEAKFIKNIDNTKNNKTLYLIPWKFENKQYIIECCEKKISIINFFEDEIYAILFLKGKDAKSYCGVVYKDIYLFESDYNNGVLRLWDLINKNLIKMFYINNNLKGILNWDSENIVLLGYQNGFSIFDLGKKLIIKNISCDNKVRLLKKIKVSQFGECLIISDDKNNIKLYFLS